METPKKKMVYVTKYALTKGIEYVEVKETFFPNLVKENTRFSRFSRNFHIGDWFENKEDAIKNAEERRIKELQSLDNQMKRISKLKFE